MAVAEVAVLAASPDRETDPALWPAEERMRRIALSWLAVAATIIVSGCSNPERPKASVSEERGAPAGAVGTGGAGANVRSDDDFVNDVAMKNMAEVELSRL